MNKLLDLNVCIPLAARLHNVQSDGQCGILYHADYLFISVFRNMLYHIA